MHKYLVFLITTLLVFSCINKEKIKVKEDDFSKKIEVAVIDTTFYNKNWQEIPSRENAAFYRPLNFAKKDSLWVIKDYYISGKLQYAAYSSGEKEVVLEGKVIWYNEDGEVIQQANYFRNIEIIPENEKEIEQQKIYEKYSIEKQDREVLLSQATGLLSEDTIADDVFLFGENDYGNASDKRIVIQLNSEDGLISQNEYVFEDNYMSKLSIDNKQLVLGFEDDNRRLTEWQRYLSFELKKEEDVNDEDYDEYYELGFLLKKDIGIAKYPYYDREVRIEKDSSDFGEVFLQNLKIKDSTNNFTWLSTQKATGFQGEEYYYLGVINKEEQEDNDEELDNVLEFLESIENDKTIYIKKGVYNFSKISYNYEGIKIENGALYVEGFSNINFIAEDEVYFVSNDENFSVVEFINCNNIKIQNVNAVHNVRETYCYAPVYSIDNSSNLTFDNCLVDGSGKYGFYIENSSKNLKILNSTITHCSSSAIHSKNDNSVLMDNVKIINNDFDSNILDLYDTTLEMKNCIIEDNTMADDYYFNILSSSLTMDNVSINTKSNTEKSGVLFNITEGFQEKTLIKNSTLTMNSEEKLFDDISPQFIDSVINKDN